MMKNIKTLLHILIGLGSTTAFAGSWILLGHSGKPVATGVMATFKGSGPSSAAPSGGTNGLAPLPTLEPLPSLNSSSAAPSSTFNLQPIQPQPSFNFAPSLRTRGS